MQYISVSHSTTRSQNDIHTGRLFCWSGALVTLSIWGAMQFFAGQNHNWNRQHHHTKPTRTTDEILLPPTPEGLAIMQRLAERRYQRTMVAKLSKAR